jgi:hypothetical protein
MTTGAITKRARETKPRSRVRVDARPIYARSVTWFNGCNGDESGMHHPVSIRYDSVSAAAKHLGLDRSDVRKTANSNMTTPDGKRYRKVKSWVFNFHDFDREFSPDVPDPDVVFADTEESNKEFNDIVHIVPKNDGQEEVFKDLSPNKQVSQWGRVRKRINKDASWGHPFRPMPTKKNRMRVNGEPFANIVHTLFIGPIAKNFVVIRKNNRNFDARASNLEAVPEKEGLKNRHRAQNTVLPQVKNQIRIRCYAPGDTNPTFHDYAEKCAREVSARDGGILHLTGAMVLRCVRKQTSHYVGYTFSNAAEADPGPPPHELVKNYIPETSEYDGASSTDEEEHSMQTQWLGVRAATAEAAATFVHAAPLSHAASDANPNTDELLEYLS